MFSSLLDVIRDDSQWVFFRREHSIMLRDGFKKKRKFVTFVTLGGRGAGQRWPNVTLKKNTGNAKHETIRDAD